MLRTDFVSAMGQLSHCNKAQTHKRHSRSVAEDDSTRTGVNRHLRRVRWFYSRVPVLCAAWLAVSASFVSLGGASQPERSSNPMLKRIGTAKFEALFSGKTAEVPPITRPDGPNNGAPDPPSAVRASYTILRTSRSVMLPCVVSGWMRFVSARYAS